ncbi:MAG: hypothetical protein IJ019_02310 [Alphaproteobacteria bacterium]|nr:hypothetical protein [Alphaproteobacteria bacterium]
MRRKKQTPLKKFLHKLWLFLISNVGAFIIGFSALFFGVYQFYIDRPIIKYDTSSRSFISSQNENNFKVTVNDTEYKDLYQTNVILQNTGQEALAGSDVSRIGHNPIRIIVPESAQMVHYTIDNTLTSQSVSANLTKYKNSLVIGFDFLNPQDQIGVSILHQNPNDNFVVKGSAIGVKQVKHVITDKQMLYIAVGLMIGIYILTIILTFFDKKGYL